MIIKVKRPTHDEWEITEGHDGIFVRQPDGNLFVAFGGIENPGNYLPNKWPDDVKSKVVEMIRARDSKK